MADVVISYAPDNRATARQLAEAVQREGYDVWWDQSDAPDSDAVTEQIVAAKAAIVVWSEAAAASDQVRAEASVARALKKLIQVSADDRAVPSPFAQSDAASISTWIGTPDHPGWLSIKAALDAQVGKAAPAEPAAPEAPVAAAGVEETTRPPEPVRTPAEPVTAAPVAAAAAAAGADEATRRPEPESALADPAPPAPPAGAQKKSKAPILIVALVALLAAAAGGGWWWMQRQKAGDVVATTEPTENVTTPAPAPPPVPAEPGTPPMEIPPLAPASEEFNRQAVVQDTAGYVIVRNAPSAIGINLGRINSGDRISTYQQSGEWWRVRMASGTVGYVPQASLRISDVQTEQRIAERSERERRAERERRRPRVRYVNSENMRAFCEGPGKGTPECRTFRRNDR